MSTAGPTGGAARPLCTTAADATWDQSLQRFLRLLLLRRW